MTNEVYIRCRLASVVVWASFPPAQDRWRWELNNALLYPNDLKLPGLNQPFLYDLHRDGDKDLIIGHKLGKIWAYHNEGFPQNRQWSRDTAYFASISFPGNAPLPVMGDFDNDGRTELVIQLKDRTESYYTDSILVYRNVGSLRQPNWVLLPGFFNVPTQGWRAPRFVDWDYDGDWDIFTTCWDSWPGRCALYRNVGSLDSAFWQYDSLVSSAFPQPFMTRPCFFDVCDLNADGAYDLVHLYPMFDVPYLELEFFTNGGSNQQPYYADILYRVFRAAELGYDPVLTWGDIDGDRDNDIVFGHTQPTLTLLPNLGSTSAPSWFWELAWLGPLVNDCGFAATSVLDLAVWDAHADNDLDIAQGYTESDDFVCPDWYMWWRAFMNQGSRQTPFFFGGYRLPHPYPVGFYMNSQLQLSSGDINRDGFEDLIYSNSGRLGTALAVSDTGYALSQNPLRRIGQIYLTHPELVDLDNDGDLDLVARDTFAQIVSFANMGPDTLPEWVADSTLLQGLERTACNRVRAGHLNDDDLADLVGWSNNSYRAYLNIGSPSAPLFQYDSTVFAEYHGPRSLYFDLADLDGDGDDDIVLHVQDMVAGVENMHTTGIDDHPSALPSALSLAAYPNPFNSRTVFHFTLAHSAQAKLIIYDVTGRLVARLLDAELGPGEHAVTWSPSVLASGLYFCRLQAEEKVAVTRVTLVK